MPPKIPLPTDEQLSVDVRETLGNLPPVNVFRMLANAPASFHGFLRLAGSILMASEFDARKREIAILRVARVTGSSYEWTCVSIQYVSSHVWEHDRASLMRFGLQAIELMLSGKVTPPPGTFFPMAHAAEAHRLLESGQHVGRIFLRP